MPYSLSDLGEIVSDAEGVSWAEAVKQQRALHANEARVAAMYAELDEAVVEAPVEIKQEVKAGSELVKIEIGKENEALTASLLERMDAMSLREQETHMALVAALHAIGTREHVVNVEAPNVSVEPAAITVEQPEITIQPPDVTVQAPEVTVHPPEVTVNLPAEDRSQKKVTFVRDPFGRLEGAEIAEE